MTFFLRALRNIGIIVLALFFAGLVTTGFHLIFSPFMDELPFKALQNAEWSERVALVSDYMKENPFAIYSAIIAHGMGAFAGSWFAVWSFHSFNKRGTLRGYRWSGAVIVGAIWMSFDLQTDLIDVPVGPLWTAVDVAVTAFMALLGYAFGGGFTKESFADLRRPLPHQTVNESDKTA